MLLAHYLLHYYREREKESNILFTSKVSIILLVLHCSICMYSGLSFI